MILPDSSAWIEGMRGTGGDVCRTLERLLAGHADVVVTEPVMMELLAGARSPLDFLATRRRLLAFPLIRVGGLETWERASAVHRACRTGGETVRSMMDCVIAAVAIREGATLLHADRDFEVIARHTGLRIEPIG